MNFLKAVEKAKSDGHDLQNDPPGYSSMSRHTCKKCGRSVLGNTKYSYGAATEEPCKK